MNLNQRRKWKKQTGKELKTDGMGISAKNEGLNVEIGMKSP